MAKGRYRNVSVLGEEEKHGVVLSHQAVNAVVTQHQWALTYGLIKKCKLGVGQKCLRSNKEQVFSMHRAKIAVLLQKLLPLMLSFFLPCNT